MKYTIILLSFLLPRVVFSQFATIQDKNGFVLVRSNPSQAANIKDTLFTNDLYFRFGLRDPAKPDWVQVDYFKGNGKHKGAGFIQESQMKPLSAFDSLARVKNEPKQVVFKKDLITVSVQAADFAMKTASKGKASEVLANFLHKKAWGVSDFMPTAQLNGIAVTVDVRNLEIPKAAIDDLYFFHLQDLKVYYDKDAAILYILMDGADGGDRYDVLWKIEKGKYKYRIVEVGL